MKPSAVKTALRELRSLRRPVFLWGPSGAGKSSVVHQSAAENKLKLVDARASQLDSIDVRGFPYPDPKRKLMEWLPADFLPREGDPDGILFLDELNGAMPSTASALYQLILDFRIGSYKLPDNWTIIAAGNNAGDRGVTHQMPAPLNNRFCHIDFEVDADDWQIQAMKDKIHAHIRAHLRLKSANLHSFDSKINPRSFPTPRSWYFANQIYKQDIPAAIKHELIVGTIGEPHAVEFFGFVRDIQHMPDIDSVMMNPERAPLPGSPAVMHALVTTLVDDRLTVGNYDRLMKYIARLPQEISVVFNRSAYAKDQRIANSSTYIDWCVANQDVIR